MLYVSLVNVFAGACCDEFSFQHFPIDRLASQREPLPDGFRKLDENGVIFTNDQLPFMRLSKAKMVKDVAPVFSYLRMALVASAG